MAQAVLGEKKFEKICRESISKDINDIAKYLQDHLGQKVTAYISGLKDKKEVGRWISGSVKPKLDKSQRLRCAYRIARMLIDTYDDETAISWLFGTNTRLKFKAPAYLLRRCKTPDDFKPIEPAAWAFVGPTA